MNFLRPFEEEKLRTWRREQGDTAAGLAGMGVEGDSFPRQEERELDSHAVCVFPIP